MLFQAPVAYSQSATPTCLGPPERQILDAVFNLEFDLARNFNVESHQGITLIPSNDFYLGLINWLQAGTQNNLDLQDAAVKSLEAVVETLKNSHAKNHSTESFLGWNLAAALTARLLLANDHLIAGYNLGNPAIKNLEKYTRGNTTPEGIAAANLAIGLDQVYRNIIPDKFKWATRFIQKNGDAIQGRKLIESALQNSSYLGPEAARVLLLEVPWSSQAICNYFDISNDLVHRYPDNPDFSIANQAISIRCGFAENALTENHRFNSRYNITSISGFTDENYSELFEQGLIRAYVETGNLDSLLNFESDNLSIHWFKQYAYAYANALDISGKRENAVNIYQSLLEKNDVPKSIRVNSKMRLNFPYTRLEKSELKTQLKMANCSQ